MTYACMHLVMYMCICLQIFDIYVYMCTLMYICTYTCTYEVVYIYICILIFCVHIFCTRTYIQIGKYMYLFPQYAYRVFANVHICVCKCAHICIQRHKTAPTPEHTRIYINILTVRCHTMGARAERNPERERKTHAHTNTHTHTQTHTHT